MSDEPVLVMRDVSVVRDGRAILDHCQWVVQPGERWVVLGPNGSGKTTLLALCAARWWPTSGEVTLLGGTLGQIDVRSLRRRIALVSGAVIRQLRTELDIRSIVVTGTTGALEPWWHHYSQADWARADELLRRSGLGDAIDRPFGVISEGERQQVLLARALIADPELLLLDEPSAGLDLGARERLMERLEGLAKDPLSPPSILVTHHAEEIPPGTTHAALLQRGSMIAQGLIDDVLTSTAVSECFEVRVEVGREAERWWARASQLPARSDSTSAPMAKW